MKVGSRGYGIVYRASVNTVHMERAPETGAWSIITVLFILKKLRLSQFLQIEQTYYGSTLFSLVEHLLLPRIPPLLFR